MSGVGVVVVAAGLGERLGATGPKALVPVAGRAMLAWALDALAAAGLPPPVVVHTPGHRAAFAAALGDRPVGALVAGGDTRGDSVRAGLAALGDEIERVVVHDAARPLTPHQVFRRTVAAVVGDVLAVAPGLLVADTLKRVDGDEVLGTVDRAGLAAIQTPQAFTRAALEAALQSGRDATDELTLVERLLADGALAGRVRMVDGSPWSHKVTTAEDLLLVEQLAVGA